MRGTPPSARVAARSLPAEERGPLFEGWVANLLRIHGEYQELFEDWFYWAPAEAARPRWTSS